MIDLLLGLAWFLMMLTPALAASSQPVVSDSGYIDPAEQNSMQLQPALVRSKRR